MSLGLHLLVVDDDVDFAESLTMLLETQACEVDHAGSAKEALALARSAPYDAVLLDIKLPDRSGLDILAELRESQPQARFIVMTGYVASDYVNAASRAGATDMLQKPFDAQILTGMLNRVSAKRPD